MGFCETEKKKPSVKLRTLSIGQKQTTKYEKIFTNLTYVWGLIAKTSKKNQETRHQLTK